MANLKIVVISGENLNKEIFKRNPLGALATVTQDYYAINAYPDNEPCGIGNLINNVLNYYPIDAAFTALPGWRFNIIREERFKELKDNFNVVEITELTPKFKANGLETAGVLGSKVIGQEV